MHRREPKKYLTFSTINASALLDQHQREVKRGDVELECVEVTIADIALAGSANASNTSPTRLQINISLFATGAVSGSIQPPVKGFWLFGLEYSNRVHLWCAEPHGGKLVLTVHD